MGKRSFFYFVLVFALLLQTQVLRAQERVYVSTDKEFYLAGESIWCSVFCVDESTGKYSQFSSVAYLEFHSKRGMEARIKVALSDGRGCGRLQVPFLRLHLRMAVIQKGRSTARRLLCSIPFCRTR